MSAQHYFGTPFAALGDKATVPNAAPVDGSVSYASGFGFDYEREQGADAAAKDIPRQAFNGLLFAITDNLKQYQLFGFPEWVTAVQNGGSPVEYSAAAFVRHAGGVWYSLVNTNTAEPGTDATKWAAFSPTAGTTLLAANNLSDLTNAGTARTNLGLGSMALQDTANWLPKNAPVATGGLTVSGGIFYTGEMRTDVLTVAAGGTRTIQVGSGNLHKLAMSASAPVAFAGVDGAVKGHAVIVELTISSNAVPTWPAGVTWKSGTVPTFSNGVHLVGFITFDGGTTWRGLVGGQGFA